MSEAFFEVNVVDKQNRDPYKRPRNGDKMKKITAILLGTLIASSAALAQTNQVLSKNAVGYVKKDFNKGLNLVAHQFEVIQGDGSRSVSNLFPIGDFPSGTIIQRWDYTNQTYSTSETKATFPSVRWNPGTSVYGIGESLWVRIPTGAASNSYVSFMMGEVPTNSKVTALGGLTFSGVSFPVAVSITNIGSLLNYPLKSGDIIQKWNASTTNYVQETYATFPPPAKWNPGTMLISPGEAIIIRRPGATSQTNWSQPKPYTWP